MGGIGGIRSLAQLPASGAVAQRYVENLRQQFAELRTRAAQDMRTVTSFISDVFRVLMGLLLAVILLAMLGAVCGA